MRLTFSKGFIRLATPDDASLLASWWADGNVMAHAGFPNGIKTDIHALKNALNNQEKSYERFILENSDKLPIGEMSQRTKEGVAMIGIKICEARYQERGIGTDALKRLITYLFDEQNVTKISLDTMIENKRAQHVYKKLGFKKIRVMKDVWTDQLGKKRTGVYFELSKKDYLDYKAFYKS
jgi:RimJ/RimL family protein N-acetyltransferase